MIPFQVYKLVHLTSIFVFLTGATMLLLSAEKSRYWKMLTGFASLFILVGGMGMLARMGMMSGFPGWVWAKIVLWLVVTGLGHMVAKRFPAHGFRAYWITILLAVTAAGFAIYKPF